MGCAITSIFNNLGSRQWDWLWLIITEKWTSIPLYLILLYFIYTKYNLKTLGACIVIALALTVLNDQLAGVFKYFFERPRPCNEDFMRFGRFIAKRCGKYGFYSAHAASSLSIAIFIGRVLKPFYSQVLFWLLIWAAIITYSRIYIGVHYPTDIIVGFFVGFIFGNFGFFLFKRFQLKYNK